MTPMAPTVPSSPSRPLAAALSGVRLARQVRLAINLAAAAAARAEIDAAIRAWQVPVDRDVAVLLTSELVTNAVAHGAGDSVTVAISCDAAGLRVEVHDGSNELPVLADVPAEAETGRGLLLVTSLSAEWGFHRTAAGKAVYFTLEFAPAENEKVTGRPGRT